MNQERSRDKLTQTKGRNLDTDKDQAHPTYLRTRDQIITSTDPLRRKIDQLIEHVDKEKQSAISEEKNDVLDDDTSDRSSQVLFALGLSLLRPEQRNQLWEYIVLTDYGTRYIPPERQPQLLKLLMQLAEEEKLYTLDFLVRLRRFEEIKEHILQEGGPYIALVQ